MTEQLIELIKDEYDLERIDAGEFSTIKSGGKKFTTDAYYIKELGHISVVREVGFFGLLKRESLIINPTERDLPLYSYDRIHALGKDFLRIELYDTLAGAVSLSALEEIKNDYAFIPECDSGAHWCDPIRLSVSISKKTKISKFAELDAFAYRYLDAYLSIGCVLSSEDARKEKRRKASVYVEGLLKNGGASIDALGKVLGDTAREEFICETVFGIGKN